MNEERRENKSINQSEIAGVHDIPYVEHNGTYHVHFYEDFLRSDATLNKYRKVRIILIVADCSKTGVNAAIDFIVNEEEDVSILVGLSQGTVDDTKLGELMSRQSAILKHAMKFPKVQSIVYTTLSVNEAENENAIGKCLEYMQMCVKSDEGAFMFELSPPVVSVLPEDINQTGDDGHSGVCGKYIKYQPSEKISGCFVATLIREVQEVKETAKDILARAAATGLLEKLGQTNLERRRASKTTKSWNEKPKNYNILSSKTYWW